MQFGAKIMAKTCPQILKKFKFEKLFALLKLKRKRVKQLEDKGK